MATATLPVTRWNSSLAWLRGFLRKELAPYPGRSALVARMVIATTLITIVGLTYRIPFTYQAAIYSLMISRESPRATLKTAGAILLVTGISAAYLLISMLLVIGSPMLHFLWVIVSLFIAFYGMSALKEYLAAVVFAVMIVLGTPLWDRTISAETNVEDTLWLCLSVLIGAVITAAVELVFVHQRPGDDIVLPIVERLYAVERLLTCYADGYQIDTEIREQVIQLEMHGTSMLRRTLRRSNYSPQYSVEMAGVIALVGRLVDLAGALTQLGFKSYANDQKRFGELASDLASFRKQLVNREVPSALQLNTGRKSTAVPLLSEMEYTVSLIPDAFAVSQSVHEYSSSNEGLRRSSLLAPDAFVNSDHLRFALKGCIAASICYVFYKAVAWPGISTSVTTCLLTALSTIGSSHQKQILRIAGALMGGFVLGMGSQIFILPSLDSTSGFVLLLVFVTAFASWFMTSSPRLSYFGIQVAVAFYLINLNDFKMEASLAIARDRVVGILFGLFIMWLVFDQLWGTSAAREMKKTFISNLRLLAQFAREPVSMDLKAATAQKLALVETINANLDKARALADGVLLEFGRSRDQDLALRDEIRRSQPQLRVLLLMQIAEWKYRAQLPGFELPEPIAARQREFDDQLARALEALAGRFEGKSTGVQQKLEHALTQLEAGIEAYSSGRVKDDRLRALLVLRYKIRSSMVTLANEK